MVFAPGTDDDPTGMQAATAQAYEMATGRPQERRSKKEREKSYTAPVIKQTPQGPKITNPYPDGFLSRIFGAQNVDYSNQMTQQQAADIEFARRNRFFAPQNVPQSSLRRGFGSLFGSSQGESTALGTLRRQVPDMKTPELVARGIAGLATPFGPVLSMVGPRGTEVTPEGLQEGVGTLPTYDPSMDPRNKDTSMLGNMLNFFTGGAGTQGAAKVAEVLPDTPTLYELLPDNIFQKPINEIQESSVANPFYPDMQRQGSLTPEMLPPGDREAAIEAYKQGDQLSPDINEHIQLYYETRS